MKKFLLTACSGLMILAATATDPNPNPSEKALKAFNESFKNAEKVNWSADNSSYEVYFEQNEIKSRIKYSEDGSVLNSIRYYSANHLPLIISTKLYKKFADKKVFGVTEVSNMETMQYQIVLEDEKNWIHVNSDAFGNFTATKKLKKA